MEGVRKTYMAILAIVMIIIIVDAFATGSLVSLVIPSSGLIKSSRPQFVADSGAIADIQAAVDQAAKVDGDVIIPAGDWSDAYNTGNHVVIPGGVNVYGAYQPADAGTGVGFSAWSTILRMSIRGAEGTTIFHLDPSNGKTCRISGIAFVGFRESSPPFRGFDGITIGDTPSPSMKDFRIDHCYFSDMGYDGIGIGGKNSRGLVDHCEFWNMMKGTTYANTIHIGYGVGYDADYEFSGWISDIRPKLGGYENGVIYVEDCYMDGVRHGTVAYAKARIVTRHCIFDRMHIMYDSGFVDCHGAYSDSYGGRYVEAYNNIFRNTEAGNPWFADNWYYFVPCKMRGGGGVFYNNRIYDFSCVMEVSYDDGNSAHPEAWLHDFWMWNNMHYNNNPNTYFEGTIKYESTHPKEGVDFFLRAPNMADDGFVYPEAPFEPGPNQAAYSVSGLTPYPHPLQGQ